MTDKQPEALRLADAIDPFVRPFAPDHLTSKVAADELRRLHEVNAELVEALRPIAEQGAISAKIIANAKFALVKATENNGEEL